MCAWDNPCPSGGALIGLVPLSYLLHTREGPFATAEPSRFLCLWDITGSCIIHYRFEFADLCLLVFVAVQM